MLHVRLVYEQIEAARGHLLAGSPLESRLALILLDNAAELLMYRELRREFAWEDQLRPTWEPAQTEWRRSGLGPKYTPEERAAAEREFEPKLRILEFRLKRISEEERSVLSICHRIRNEAFHQGDLRTDILRTVAMIEFQAVVGLTVKLPPQGFRVAPRYKEDDAFLQRYGLKDPTQLAFPEGTRAIADALLVGLQLEGRAGVQALSDDLVQRCEETLGGLAMLSESDSDEKIDHDLKFTQFWRDVGVDLAKRGILGGSIDQAFEQWLLDGHAKYTLPKLRRLRRQAEAIARQASAARALRHYAAVEGHLRPLEEDVARAVFEYEERINAEIHDRRL